MIPAASVRPHYFTLTLLVLISSDSPIPILNKNAFRIALAFEVLTPRDLCSAFSRALRRPVHYTRAPIQIRCPIPSGYEEQLSGIEALFGKHDDALYFGLGVGGEEGLSEARGLWEGWRGVEEYAREVFIEEERANGRAWAMTKR